MADPLSITASVIAVVAISKSILSACYGYIRSAKNAQTDIIKTVNGISGLKSILGRLQETVAKQIHDESPSPLIKLLGTESGPINTCRTALLQIKSKLVPTLGKSKSATALKWP